MTQADASIERFVRGTLGCACPDEVFQQIETSALPGDLPGDLPGVRLVIGNRLLVYVALAPASLVAATRALVAAGRRERDARGWNRFRLVLATEAPEAERTAAADAFASAAAGDERAHLHVLAPAALPAVLSSACRRSAAAG